MKSVIEKKDGILKSLENDKPKAIADISSIENEILGDEVKVILSAMEKEGLVEYTDKNGKKLTRDKFSDIQQTEANYVKITNDGITVKVFGYEQWKDTHPSPVDILALQISKFVERVEENEWKENLLKWLTMGILFFTAFATCILAYVAFFE